MTMTGRMYPPTEAQETREGRQLSPNVWVTGFIYGPFAIVVTNPLQPKDDAYPLIVCPEGGFQTADEALLYIEKNYANRKEPYLGLTFSVSPMWSQNNFDGFCSWED